MIDFWKLTPREILQGIQIIENPTLYYPTHPLNEFAYNLALQEMAYLWMDCDQDMTLLKLKYADTIQRLGAITRQNGHA